MLQNQRKGGTGAMRHFIFLLLLLLFVPIVHGTLDLVQRFERPLIVYSQSLDPDSPYIPSTVLFKTQLECVGIACITYPAYFTMDSTFLVLPGDPRVSKSYLPASTEEPIPGSEIIEIGGRPVFHSAVVGPVSGARASASPLLPGSASIGLKLTPANPLLRLYNNFSIFVDGDDPAGWVRFNSTMAHGFYEALLHAENMDAEVVDEGRAVDFGEATLTIGAGLPYRVRLWIDPLSAYLDVPPEMYGEIVGNPFYAAAKARKFGLPALMFEINGVKFPVPKNRLLTTSIDNPDDYVLGVRPFVRSVPDPSAVPGVHAAHPVVRVGGFMLGCSVFVGFPPSTLASSPLSVDIALSVAIDITQTTILNSSIAQPLLIIAAINWLTILFAHWRGVLRTGWGEGAEGGRREGEGGDGAKERLNKEATTPISLGWLQIHEPRCSLLSEFWFVGGSLLVLIINIVYYTPGERYAHFTDDYTISSGEKFEYITLVLVTLLAIPTLLLRFRQLCGLQSLPLTSLEVVSNGCAASGAAFMAVYLIFMEGPRQSMLLLIHILIGVIACTIASCGFVYGLKVLVHHGLRYYIRAACASLSVLLLFPGCTATIWYCGYYVFPTPYKEFFTSSGHMAAPALSVLSIVVAGISAVVLVFGKSDAGTKEEEEEEANGTAINKRA